MPRMERWVCWLGAMEASTTHWSASSLFASFNRSRPRSHRKEQSSGSPRRKRGLPALQTLPLDFDVGRQIELNRGLGREVLSRDQRRAEGRLIRELAERLDDRD